MSPPSRGVRGDFSSSRDLRAAADGRGRSGALAAFGGRLPKLPCDSAAPILLIRTAQGLWEKTVLWVTVEITAKSCDSISVEDEKTNLGRQE